MANERRGRPIEDDPDDPGEDPLEDGKADLAALVPLAIDRVRQILAGELLASPEVILEAAQFVLAQAGVALPEEESRDY